VSLVTIPRVAGDPNFAGPDKAVCFTTSTSIGSSSVSGYTYKWSPKNFLNLTTANPATYQNTSTVVLNPSRYSLKATKLGCNFVDYTDIYTVYAAVQKEVDVDCGPVWFNQKEGSNPPSTTYTWEKTAGTGTLTILSTRNGGRDAYIKSTGGTSVSFRRKTVYNGVTCYSETYTLNTACPCPNGTIQVFSSLGCASPAAGPYKIQLSVPGFSSSNKKIKWSPSSAVDNDTIFAPTVITTNQTALTATVTDRFDNTLTCNYSINVNAPTTVPVFNAPDKTVCPGVPVSLGLANNASYTYYWNNASGMTNPEVDRKTSNPTAKINSTTQYTVKVTHNTSGCYIIDTVNVTVPLVVAYAGQDQSTCLGNVVEIGSAPPPNTNFTYAWTPIASPWTNGTNETLPMPELLANLPSQTLILTVTEPVSGCSLKDTVVISGSS